MNKIIFEQPLNELIRVCLRLESLFNQLDHAMQDTSILGTRNVFVIINNLLQLLDRPDLKAKLAKELSAQIQILSRLQSTPQIDQHKLQEILIQLDELSRCFISSSGKIAQSLREIELLNNLRLHLSTPGGGCSFDIPVFHKWLQQPADIRLATIKGWLEEFKNIRLANDLVLKLVREESKTQDKVAKNGFHQELLDPQVNLKLIRVIFSNAIQAYPEISIGRHFLSIRFFVPAILDRPTQYAEDLAFELSYCTA